MKRQNRIVKMMAVALAALAAGLFIVGCERCTCSSSRLRDAGIADSSDTGSKAPETPDANRAPEEPVEGVLRIYFLTLVEQSDGTKEAPPRQGAMEGLIRAFNGDPRYSQVTVKSEFFGYEELSKRIEHFTRPDLSEQERAEASPDLFVWFGGERMRGLKDQLRPLDHVWRDQDLDLHENMSSALSAVAVDGVPYGVPYTADHWAIYYRTDFLAGKSPPEDWEALLRLCEDLQGQRKGLAPVAIGTKYSWPAVAWFDYLDLRINGADFHQKLMDGTAESDTDVARYDSQKVGRVLEVWGDMIRRGCFLRGHQRLSSEEVVSHVLRLDKAAMSLFGTKLTESIPAVELSNYGVFRFPTFSGEGRTGDEEATDCEVAVLEMFLSPRGARNPGAADAFLAFAASEPAQTAINKVLRQIPLHKKARTISGDPFLAESADIVHRAKGLVPLYDSNTHPDMVELAMVAFREFMLDPTPERQEEILRRLEEARKTIFETARPGPTSSPLDAATPSSGAAPGAP